VLIAPLILGAGSLVPRPTPQAHAREVFHECGVAAGGDDICVRRVDPLYPGVAWRGADGVKSRGVVGVAGRPRSLRQHVRPGCLIAVTVCRVAGSASGVY
jgi:hypothetical protein